MISSSSGTLIKLCVVFSLNFSWFTTGTAPPLSHVIVHQPTTTSTTTTIPTTTMAEEAEISGHQKDSLKNVLPTSSDTTAKNKGDGEKDGEEGGGVVGGQEAATPPVPLVNVTAEESSEEIKPTLSTKEEIGYSTEGVFFLPVLPHSSTTTPTSLSKKFETVVVSQMTRTLEHGGVTVGREYMSDIFNAASESESGSFSHVSSSKSSVPSYPTIITSRSEYGEGLTSPATASSNSFLEQETKESTNLRRTSEAPPIIISAKTVQVPHKTTSPADALLPNSNHNSLPSTSKDQLPEEEEEETLDYGALSDGFVELEPTEEEQGPEEVTFGSRGKILFDRDYSPEQVAEYIFVTGDERGVASAVNDLINDGGAMLSKKEAIHFLEEVKAHLTFLRGRFQAFLMEEEGEGKRGVV